MSTARSTGMRKLGRTILQWVLSLGSTGLTALASEALGINFGPLATVAFQAFYLFLYTYAQNTLETAGRIRVLLPTSGLISEVLAPAVGAATDAAGAIISPPISATVEAVSDTSGGVVGVVEDLTGGIVGTVTGQLPPDDPETGHH